MTDLITIRARIRNAYMDFKGDDRAFYAALGDVKNLLAEVEALRAEQAETRAALESYHLGHLTVRDALKRWVPGARLVGLDVVQDGPTLVLRVRVRAEAVTALVTVNLLG